MAKSNDTRDGSDVKLTFEQALEVIKRIDLITPCLPKIVYLVGWQFFGHDSKYPSWDEVNKSLKRKDDKTALDSIKWLMEQGCGGKIRINLAPRQGYLLKLNA